MKFLIVDDDVNYCNTLIEQLKKLGYLDVTSTQDMLKGLRLLETDVYDYVFLDYNLSNETTAVDFIQSLKFPGSFKLVIITEYYTLSTFESIKVINPVSFLLKGFDDLALLQTIELLKDNDATKPEIQKLDESVMVKKGEVMHKIWIQDIIYVESDGRYQYIHTESEKFMINNSLKNLVEMLPDYFIRIHQSYLVNSNKITSLSLSNNIVSLGSHSLSIGRKYKNDILDLLPIIG